MFWHKFARAALEVAVLRPRVQFPMVLDLTVEALSCAEYFYLPGEEFALDGQQITDEVKATQRLPFDVTAVLARGPTLPNLGTGWMLIIGVDPHGAFNAKHRIFDPTGLNGYFLFSLLNYEDRWVPDPYIRMLDLSPALGYRLRRLMPDGMTEQLEPDSGLSDANRIMSLCWLLSLRNVRHETVAVPTKLAKSAQKRQGLLLRDYHVLRVGGDLWDKPSQDGQSDGYRSHMRRGHIRTLTPEKRVWVRHTFVKGRKPGFADKGYTL